MVLRFYDPVMVYNHDRLEPVTVINFSEFERSFSPFHPSGNCRNRAGSGSNPWFPSVAKEGPLWESSAGELLGVRQFAACGR